ncbi:hypothetical protein HELRODRAFT_182220 [Helobdella robusta]|uniref:C2H2-type domain-containing protein n=1 Tax=Helobdella robusta TaxID=6412 RepID=T1FHY3_HELRO|nr:hypothetical protein HELRODRAFT_182220 [Helobdella robusta]ESN91145.1 hypothetical protein HELRODRAFT_182220 [Helobdella robusta]
MLGPAQYINPDYVQPLPTSSTTQPTTLNNNKNDLLSLYRNSFYNHFHPTKLPEDYFNPMYPPFSKISPSAAAVSATASPTSTFKSQQEMLQAALAYSYSPWLLAGQSPFLPMSPFDPFLLSAAALSAQQQQQQHKHLLMQHLQQQQHLGALTGQKNFDYSNDEAAVNLSPSHSTPSPKINNKSNHSQKSSPNNNKNEQNTANNHNNTINSTKKRPVSPASSSNHGKRSPTGSLNKPFPCNWLQPGSDFCGRRFESYEELLEHLKTHVAETTPSIPTNVDSFKNDLATLPLLKSSHAPTATSSPPYEDSKLFPPHLFPFLFSSTHQSNPYSSFVGAGLYLQQQQQFQQQQLHQQLQQQHQQHSPRSSSSPSSHHSPTNRFHPYKPSAALASSSSSSSSASSSSSSSSASSSSLSSSSIPSSLFQSLMPTLMPLNTITPPSLMTSSSYGGVPFPPMVLPQRCNETAS